MEAAAAITHCCRSEKLNLSVVFLGAQEVYRRSSHIITWTFCACAPRAILNSPNSLALKKWLNGHIQI